MSQFDRTRELALAAKSGQPADVWAAVLATRPYVCSLMRGRHNAFNEALLALFEEFCDYAPERASLITWAHQICKRVITYDARAFYKHAAKSLSAAEGDELHLSIREDGRPVPPSFARCLECDRLHKDGAYRVFGLCPTCDRARNRAIAKGWGRGVCARHGRVLRSKVRGRPKVNRTIERRCPADPSCPAPLTPSPRLAVSA